MDSQSFCLRIVTNISYLRYIHIFVYKMSFGITVVISNLKSY